MEENHKLLPPPNADHKKTNFSKVKDHKESERNHINGLGSQTGGKYCYLENGSTEGASSELDKLTDSLKSMNIFEKISENPGSSCSNFAT